MSGDLAEIEKRLWAAADDFRANSGLMPSEYAAPVLGMLFLRQAEARFNEVGQRLGGGKGRRGGLDPDDYKANGAMYLPEEARFSHLLALPGSEDLGKAVNGAMAAIEKANTELEGALPRTYGQVPKATLQNLLKLLAPLDIPGDAFGKVYEYFMGAFAMATMQKGGEFYTPESIVRLIVEVIEPFHGRILDPACGSGGMFVHSADFVRRHQRSPEAEISVFGTEKVRETLRMCRMNLAVHGLWGNVKESNTYYEDPHNVVGGFDFVMANPPFNVDGVDKARIAKDPRFPWGIPGPDNANYLWIQLFWSALNANGRSGFVMANSAGDARGSEAEIRRKMIETGTVDVIVGVGPNFFYTVTLPCTLWFFDKAKAKTTRKDQVLFIDARHVFRQIDRAHRDFTDGQIAFLANIVRLWRERDVEHQGDSEALLAAKLPEARYVDVPGLCKAATLAEIEAQGWSLNPGRYVGAAPGETMDAVDFKERLEALQEELEILNAEAARLQARIAQNVAEVLQA
ncbi:SAM-dependent DNA methyltransferase [Roseomonas sp. PWR1]|uniref:site-specific DNA-methyltransferase (adenine-specific) n=1 Tax=Roseomonas nitratireducens TaxID=2820810 RepID=A0ABS4AWW3_9PROT|nr:class I SAM-dependent DNA methyltransferase [Neoroseomonas nitratireducens]MBP0465880.1 SAM-dependent DNA methyltransferase [Neoroseomonas nitratireducens]